MTLTVPEAKEKRRLEEENAKLKKLVAQFAMEIDTLKVCLGVARTRGEIEIWRVDSNCERPHSALDYRTPKAFGGLVRRQVPAGAESAVGH